MIRNFGRKIQGQSVCPPFYLAAWYNADASMTKAHQALWRRDTGIVLNQWDYKEVSQGKRQWVSPLGAVQAVDRHFSARGSIIYSSHVLQWNLLNFKTQWTSSACGAYMCSMEQAPVRFIPCCAPERLLKSILAQCHLTIVSTGISHIMHSRASTSSSSLTEFGSTKFMIFWFLMWFMVQCKNGKT